MGDASEVVRKVGVYDVGVTTEQLLLHLDHRLLGVAPSTIGVEFRWKIGFEDRRQHQRRRSERVNDNETSGLIV